MSRIFSSLAMAAALAFCQLPGSSANAMTVGTAPGLHEGVAQIGGVEQVRRVCRHRLFTSRRECYVDRSRPPTVCHRIRGTNRLDCY